jgi:hypothetical protein
VTPDKKTKCDTIRKANRVTSQHLTFSGLSLGIFIMRCDDTDCSIVDSLRCDPVDSLLNVDSAAPPHFWKCAETSQRLSSRAPFRIVYKRFFREGWSVLVVLKIAYL